MQLFSKITFLDKVLFTKHLAVMIKSGVSLSEALQNLTNQTKSSALKKILKGILLSVENGTNLSDALKKYPDVFDSFYINIIEVSEESSSLDENLEYLAKQMQKTYEFKRKVRSAMLYPSFIFFTALFLGAGISLFVLPKLTSLFSAFDAKLPATTQVLMFLSETMRDYGYIIFAIIFGIVILFKSLLMIPSILKVWQSFLLKLPIVSNIIIDIQMGGICRNLGMMLKGGLPITAALKIEAENTENLIYKSYLEEINGAVSKGKSINAFLGVKKFKYIPSLVVSMLGVGEKTGKLDENLLYLGDFFEGELDASTKNISTVLEPILLVFIAALVGFVAFAIITPIYDFTSSVRSR
jgi:type IV pilus assembly protein PilC